MEKLWVEVAIDLTGTGLCDLVRSLWAGWGCGCSVSRAVTGRRREYKSRRFFAGEIPPGIKTDITAREVWIKQIVLSLLNRSPCPVVL